MRVAHVSQATTAGVGRFLDHVVMDQRARGWEVSIACPPEPGLVDRCTQAGARHLPWHAVRSPHSGLLTEGRALARLLDEADPDVVFLHASKAGLVGRLVLRGHRPTVFCPHAWSFLDGSRVVRPVALAWERWAARWTSAVLCVSDAERCRGEAAGVRAEARTIPNAVDGERFRPAARGERDEIRAARGVGEEPTAVCVGRLSVQKGQDVLLDAWPRVLASVPTARLFLVGDGPARARLLARETPRVTFVGAQDEARAWMLLADVVVQPSRWEGASFVTLEAMACGRSVVVTDVDGAREAFGAATDAGVIVPVNDAPQLAAALIERLTDPHLAAAEGIRAHERSRAFGLRPWGDAVAALTTEVAGERTPST